MLIFVTLSFKVETVGDKYMAVSGLPTRCSRHAVNIVNLALDMMDIVQEVNARGKKMQVYSSCYSLMREQPGGGGTLGIFGWGCATGPLDPLAHTRASSAEFCFGV